MHNVAAGDRWRGDLPIVLGSMITIPQWFDPSVAPPRLQRAANITSARQGSVTSRATAGRLSVIAVSTRPHPTKPSSGLLERL